VLRAITRPGRGLVLTVVLLSGELACVVVWAFTGAIFALVVGLVAGVSVLLVALRSDG
jgi:hypothetical protein